MRHLWTGCGIFTGPSSRRLRPRRILRLVERPPLLHQMNPPFGLETSQSDRDGAAVEGAAEPLAEAGVELLGHGRGAEGFTSRLGGQDAGDQSADRGNRETGVLFRLAGGIGDGGV